MIFLIGNSDSEIMTALGISLRAGLLAAGLNLPGALLLGWFLARKKFPGREAVIGITQLPMVLPPVTIGYGLLLLFGRNGLVGRKLIEWWNFPIAFTWGAAVLASMVVSFPLVLRSVRIAIEMCDEKMEQTAWSLGYSRAEAFLRVVIPAALPGITGGFLLSFARSFGEFGATMIFAGNIPGKTRSIPLAIYSALQKPGEEYLVFILAAISVAVALFVFISAETIMKRAQRKEGTS